MAQLEERLADAPLYLSWKRQGKIWWTESWLETHGPVRQRIPHFDDHISFANYDLRLNELPQIAKTDEGRPFVNCLAPLSPDELVDVLSRASVVHPDPSELDRFMKTRVYERVGTVASILNVVHYHGFEPAVRTAGLDYLDEVAPRQELRRVDS